VQRELGEAHLLIVWKLEQQRPEILSGQGRIHVRRIASFDGHCKL
jgi:hypothetical protein